MSQQFIDVLVTWTGPHQSTDPTKSINAFFKRGSNLAPVPEVSSMLAGNFSRANLNLPAFLDHLRSLPWGKAIVQVLFRVEGDDLFSSLDVLRHDVSVQLSTCPGWRFVAARWLPISLPG